jgi:hypothetical protein
MYRTAGPRSLDEDKMYLAEFIAEDAGKVLDDLPASEQKVFIDRAERALIKSIKQFQVKEVTVESVITDIKKLEPMDSMKEANKVLKGEGRYKSLSKADREKIVNDESVTDHIFEREIKPDPEDLAYGGVAGMLGERTGFKFGGIDKARRLFLQAMGAGAAGIGAAKTGLFGLLKGGGKKGATVAKELTQVPIKSGVDGMPAWFKPLVNKVIKEGDDVTKKFATQERQIVHKTELPDSQTDVLVTQDLTTGNVSVDIGLEKHGFSSGKFGQPVRLEYKASEVIEPKISKTGEIKKPGTKTKEEFWVEEAEFTGGHPENVKFEESSFNKFGKHESDFSEVEAFAKGKRKKDARKVSESFDKLHEDVADYESLRLPPDDFASGGIARMLGE